MTPRIALTLLVFLSASAAHAGTVAVWDYPEDGHETTFYQTANRLRIVDLGDMGPDSAMLFDAGTKQVVVVHDDAGAYFDLTAAMRKLRPQLERLEGMAARVSGRQPTIDTHYLPLKEKRTIAGLACEMYDRFDDGRVTLEACYVTPGLAAGLEETHRLTQELGETLANGLMRPKRANVTGDRAPPGLAIWRQEIGPDRKRGAVIQLKSFRTEDLPGAIFSVPAEYHQVDEPLNPPRDGAARQRALKLARSSPRDDADRSASAPPASPTITGAVIFAILVFMTIGLFIHAFCLHLVAGFVLEESRYINAVVAVGIVWILAIPLERLHVWEPAAIVIELCVAFGALKLAYGTSTARTFALLFAVALVAAAIVFAAMALGLLASR